MHRQILIVLFSRFSSLIGFGAACGDDEPPGPTAPTTPTTPVTPAAPTLTGVSLLAPVGFTDNPMLDVGETVQLNLDADYSDGSTKRVTEEAAWTSSNEQVATVTAGLVTGAGVGEANVQAGFETLDGAIDFRVEMDEPTLGFANTPSITTDGLRIAAV